MAKQLDASNRSERDAVKKRELEREKEKHKVRIQA
jgi:hypothetical protein